VKIIWNGRRLVHCFLITKDNGSPPGRLEMLSYGGGEAMLRAPRTLHTHRHKDTNTKTQTQRHKHTQKASCRTTLFY
jgi:hypothetical protein